MPDPMPTLAALLDDCVGTGEHLALGVQAHGAIPALRGWFTVEHGAKRRYGWLFVCSGESDEKRAWRFNIAVRQNGSWSVAHLQWTGGTRPQA